MTRSAEFDRLAEPAAERLGDLGAQVTFDLVLHKAAGHRQQSKPLDDLQGLDKVQPCALLGCERSHILLTVIAGGVCSGLTVEFGDDRIPDRREA